MTRAELIKKYVTAHADNRWMDASELEALLTEFAEHLQSTVDAESPTLPIGVEPLAKIERIN